MPILLFLREHVQDIIANQPSLADLIRANEEKRGTRPPAGWFAGKLEQGACLVLLDGLD